MEPVYLFPRALELRIGDVQLYLNHDWPTPGSCLSINFAVNIVGQQYVTLNNAQTLDALRTMRALTDIIGDRLP